MHIIGPFWGQAHQYGHLLNEQKSHAVGISLFLYDVFVSE